MTIAGHRTSIALEPEFWAGLQALADAEAIGMPALIRRIDEGRQSPNLSSALRVAVLEFYQRPWAEARKAD